MSLHIPVEVNRWTEMVQASSDVIQLRSTVQDLALRVKMLEAAGDGMAALITKAAQEAAKDNGDQSAYLIRCVKHWERVKEGGAK